MIYNLSPFAWKRRPTINDPWYEPLAVWNAPINASCYFRCLNGNVAGAFSATPDDDGLASETFGNFLHRRAVQKIAIKSRKAWITCKAVWKLMSSGTDN